MTVYQYIIPNKKVIIYQIFAYAIIILNILGLYFFSLRYTDQNFSIIPIAAAITIIILWDLYRYKKKKNLKSIGIFILLLGIFWLSCGVLWLLFLNLLLWAMYMISKRRLIISISETNIIYPSLPEKKINWNELNNIILKDDIITIDLKSNKIYQHFIEYADKEINEAEFNDFCKNALKSRS